MTYMTSGWYAAGQEFCELTQDARVRGIDSLSDYLGYYCRATGDGKALIVEEVIDIDDEADYQIACRAAERWDRERSDR